MHHNIFSCRVNKAQNRARSSRYWTLCALILAVAVHVYVLDRLLHLSPDPQPPSPHRPMRPDEVAFEFAAQPVVAQVMAPALPNITPPVQKTLPRKPTTPQVAAELPAAEIAIPEYELPEATAGDLLRQMGRVAAESIEPTSTDERWLDLGVQADADNRAIKPERRNAGLGGAPTRGDRAPVGDLANGMLIERWQEMHHGNGSLDCSKQPDGEPLSGYLARCKQGL